MQRAQMMRMPPSVASFSLLTPLLLCCLGLGQIALWHMWRKHQSMLWMGSAFLAVSLGITVQLLWHPDALLQYVLVFSLCYLAGFGCMGKALACRMQVRFDVCVACAVAALCILLQVWCTVVVPSLSARVYIINLSTMALLGLPLLAWRGMQVRHRFDELLRWLFVLYILSGLVRLIVLLPHSQAVRVHDFTQTWFWLGAHVMLMGLGMLGASAMFLAVFSDVLAQLQTDRQMEALSVPMLQDQTVTMSIGVAPLHSLAAADVAQAMEAADAQLYAAKRAGRNRVSVQAL